MNSEEQKFKDKFDLKQRQDESSRVKRKYPNRIPVIVERAENCNEIAKIDKTKYLVPGDLTVGQFIYVIRKRIKLNSEQALFVFVNETMPTISENLSIVYRNHEDEDGFLYITYSGENTFWLIIILRKKIIIK